VSKPYTLLNDDFTWSDNPKVRFSDKGIVFNKCMTEKVGDYVLFGFDTDSKKIIIKKGIAEDSRCRKTKLTGKKGNSAIYVSPRFFEFYHHRGLQKDQVIEFTLNEEHNYFEGGLE
jgi:hypothetical protein